MMTLAEAQGLVDGSTLVGNGDRRVTRVHTDTRSLQPGDLFVALRGERFDGHDFLTGAREAGAAGAIAERGLNADFGGLQVRDTQAALSRLASGWRHRFAGPLVAVTGSNGKTTVTQMIGAILRAWLGEAALSTQGNLNNHIGLPLTLLRLRPTAPPWHRAAVVELGMNHPGEIGELAAIARPTVALVNNAQREHQEFMASVETVARENGAALEALAADGTAVFPAVDAHAALWRRLAGGRRIVDFALHDEASGAAVTGEAAWQPEQGRWELAVRTPAGALHTTLALPGRHNVHNALAAAACAVAAGVPVEAVGRGLAGFRPVAGRSRLLKVRWRGQALTLVDDAYNANPDSVRAGIDLLATLPGPRWLVLGDMGEVGDQGPAFHREVGAHAARRGIEAVWGVGAACAGAVEAYRDAGGSARTSRHFERVEPLIEAIARAPQAASALVKGSRFMRMERVVAALAGHGTAGGAT
jgi:UDP-N-acetylmuramoyl-tripeptide--D-alanyl-D-alanine ligase